MVHYDVSDPRSVYTHSDYALAGGAPPSRVDPNPRLGQQAAQEVAQQTAQEVITGLQRALAGGVGGFGVGDPNLRADEVRSAEALKAVMREAMVEAHEETQRRSRSTPSMSAPGPAGFVGGGEAAAEVMARRKEQQEIAALMGISPSSAITGSLTDTRNLTEPGSFSIAGIRQSIGRSLSDRLAESSQQRLHEAGFGINAEGELTSGPSGRTLDQRQSDLEGFWDRYGLHGIAEMPDLQQQAAEIAQGGSFRRFGRSFATGLAEGDGVMGAAARGLPAGLAAKAGMVGAAVTAWGAAGDKITDLSNNADNILRITGGEIDNGARLGTLGYQSRSKWRRFKHGWLNPMSGLSEEEILASEAAALELAAGDGALRDNYTDFFLNTSPYLRPDQTAPVLDKLARRGAVDLKAFERAIVGVAEAAEQAGLNAKDLQNSFLRATEAASKYASATDAVAIGQSHAQVVANAGGGFEQLTYTPASNIGIRTAASVALGINPTRLAEGLRGDGMVLTEDEAQRISGALGIDVGAGQITVAQAEAIIQKGAFSSVDVLGMEQTLLSLPGAQEVLANLRTVMHSPSQGVRDAAFKEAADRFLDLANAANIDESILISQIRFALSSAGVGGVPEGSEMEYWLKWHLGALDQFGEATEVHSPTDGTQTAGVGPRRTGTTTSWSTADVVPLTLAGTAVASRAGVDGTLRLDEDELVQGWRRAQQGGTEGAFIQALTQAVGAGAIIPRGQGENAGILSELGALVDEERRSGDSAGNARASRTLAVEIADFVTNFNDDGGNITMPGTGGGPLANPEQIVDYYGLDIEAAGGTSLFDPKSPIAKATLESLLARGYTVDQVKGLQITIGDGRSFNLGEALESDLFSEPEALRFAQISGPDGTSLDLRTVLGSSYSAQFGDAAEAGFSPAGVPSDLDALPQSQTHPSGGGGGTITLSMSPQLERWFEAQVENGELTFSQQEGRSPDIQPRWWEN